MKKEIIIVIVLAVVIIVLAGILLWPSNKPADNNQQTTGIQITSPKNNEEISSPIKVAGMADGQGWTGFEGQVGTVRLFNANGGELGSAVLTATTDWTNPPVSFETYLNFQSDSDQPGSLVFRNENPSGLPENNKEFVLPVKILKSSGEIMKIKVYFNNNKIDPEASCNKVFSVVREIPKIEAVGSAALWQLLIGPTQTEKDAGFFTSINEEVKLQSLEIKQDGTAVADFDEQLEAGVGGSCKVSAIRAQIAQTLKQFLTVKNVVISINGRTEDILQP